MWNWFRWRYQFRRQELTAFIWFIPLLWIGWFIWKAGYQVMAVILVIAATGAGIWLQWALFSARLSPNAARSTMAVSDPVYDIPLREDDDRPSNPASDPLYDTDTDFTEAPAEPAVDPLARATDEGEKPSAASG
ncbi:MAG TPA: hypothetical protein VGF71_06715 [Caulobacteraceae bacterium]|jgi:hypothetical protein